VYVNIDDCGYAPTGTIGLSRLLVEVNDVIQVTDTILHEIAHALTLGDGHGYAWKRVLRLVQNPKDAIRIKILFHLQ
jgi:predicted SprT family Zn-dependent metalloprotease